jgi:uncharacterized protein
MTTGAGGAGGPNASGPAPTLLVFAKAPVPGRVKTRLAGELGTEGAADLYRKMGRLVVDRVRSGPWRTLILYDPPGEEASVRQWLGDGGDLEFRPQSGGDLGLRMAEAFAGAFGPGPRIAPVVVIGTDAPGLDGALVAEAFTALNRALGPDLVLGPATDGGYYLLGLRSPEPELFQGLPWSTNRVLGLTLERARKLGLTLSLLRPLSDVDRPEDLPTALSVLPDAGQGSHPSLPPASPPGHLHSPNPTPAPDPSMAANPLSPDRIQRVRCQGVYTEISQDSSCHTRVEVEWTSGAIFEGEGEGSQTAEGRIRAGALAALRAAENATGGSLQLHLRGAKAIRAFDRHVVIVALRGESPNNRYDLIGSAAAPDDDLVRGAVLAVLNGTNRILGRYVEESVKDPDPGR